MLLRIQLKVITKCGRMSNVNKKILLLIMLVLLMGAVSIGCSKDKKTDKNGNDDSAILTEKNIKNLQKGKHHAEIEVKDYGTIKVELDADAAPISVTNFMNLAKDKFYDGLTFHRIINGFVIQGGDPEGNGTGGSDRCIKGEFSSNGVKNKLSHTRGAISMARSSENDSASSQFFIMHQDNTRLDGDYAVFGYVTEGMEIVDKICKKVKVEDDNGTVLAENQPVIKCVKIID